VSRLDGFTEADAIGLIDRALTAGRDGNFLLDQRGTGDRVADPWLQAAADQLSAAGFKERIVLDPSTSGLTDRPNVFGYASWGSNDPGIRRRRLGLGFVPGALAAMFVSTDARTMQEPPADWQPGPGGDPKASFAGSPQSLTGDLIRDGVTGVAGNVAEPYLDGAIRPDILFPAYIAGFNLIESFYLAMPHLSWQTIVFGDPLCAPFRSDKTLTREQGAPDLDAETELPKYLSARRLGAATAANVPTDAAKLMLKAEARRSRDDTIGMREALEKATAIDPRFTAAQTMLASVYEELGEYDRAIERYQIVLGVNPSDPVVLNNLAYALAVRKGVPGDALPFAQKAYIAAKRNALIADTLAWIYYLLGHHADAEKYVTEAAKLAPDHAEIQLHLAHVYLALGRTDAALAALNRSLQLDVKFSARDDVRKLQAKLKDSSQ
jgi:tetratricopeptide (TPR) repeat protein